MSAVSESPPIASETLEKDKQVTCGGYFQQRIFFADLDKIIASEINYRNGFRIFNRAGIITADSRLDFSCFDVLRINHFLALSQVIIFCFQGEFIVGTNQNNVISHTPNIAPQSNIGCGDVPPVRVEDSAVFVGRNGERIYDLNYQRNANGFIPTDITLFASHLFKNQTILGMCWQSDENRLYAWRDDGKVNCLTYVKEQSILAWSQLDFGGQVESMCCIPEYRKVGDKSLLKDSVYMIVRREVNVYDNAGDKTVSSKRLIERMAVRDFANQEEMVFMDSAKSFEF